MAEKTETEIEEERGMYKCPYCPSMMCNQKKIMCEKGHYDAHCLMGIMSDMNSNIQYNHNALRREGMELAVLYLFDNDYIMKKYGKHSAHSLVEIILKDEETQKRIADNYKC
jgi:hypothetical protein